jgi:hypothetical protein
MGFVIFLNFYSFLLFFGWNCATSRWRLFDAAMVIGSEIKVAVGGSKVALKILF